MSRFTTHKWLRLCSVLCLFQYIFCDCALPELNFPNGKVILPPLYENGTMVDELSILQFICFDEYILMGVAYLQCLFDEWTDNVPFCAGLRCSAPPKVENAKHETNGLTAGSFVEYKCNEGYELESTNATSLQCFVKNNSDTAEWRGKLPRCIAKTGCPDPGVSSHGVRWGPCCKSGNILEFFCKNSSYELVGKNKIQCLRSGRWSDNRPLCKPQKACELPPALTHGEISSSKTGDYFVQGETAYIACHAGYKVNGNSDSTCLAGSWDKNFGTCEEIFCDAPAPLGNGSIPELKTHNGTKFPYKFDINYVCDKGYKLESGDSWSTCGRRGWSGKKRRCVVVTCPDVGNPDNGMKHGDNYSIGAKISFSCDEEYELLGSYERYCLPNGQWDGKLARCNIESNYCPDPGTPVHGSKNKKEYQRGDKVRFQCSPGHRMMGSEIRECLPDGTWSGHETNCLSYEDFDDNKKLGYILKNVVNEKAAWQKEELKKYEEAVRSVNANGTADLGKSIDLNYSGRIILYFVFDVSGSIGRNNLVKSIEFAKAIVRKVGISPKGAHAGAIQFTSKAEILFFPMSLKTTNEVLQNLDRINSTGGATSPSVALKTIREEHMRLVEWWIPGVDVKNILFIMTDGRVNTGGNPVHQADLLKALGVEIYCIGITGDVKQKLLYDIASSSTYGKDMEMLPNVFMLNNYDTLAWLVNEITNGTIDYSECGVGVETVGVQIPKVVGGNNSAQPWPWMAALYMKIGVETPVRWKFQCGGSIIHPRFILTAAHCMFTNRGRDERKPDDINVKLGLTNLQNKTILKEFTVRRIIIHEQYSKNYNNDIALLELNRPIEFGRYIRPICLPPKEKGELYKPLSTTWATGWGATEPRKNNDIDDPLLSQDLREIHFPIRDRVTCERSLRDQVPPMVNHFTDRMFCAGTGQGGNDTCKGDSGGPVMQRSVNKDGYPIWIQVGIISWSVGCGQVGEYGFYTHVHELMPWIEKYIKNP